MYQLVFAKIERLNVWYAGNNENSGGAVYDPGCQTNERTKYGLCATRDREADAGGTTKIAAAWFGVIKAPSNPIAIVGRPIPMTPLTTPASTKMATTRANSNRS